MPALNLKVDSTVALFICSNGQWGVLETHIYIYYHYIVNTCI